MKVNVGRHKDKSIEELILKEPDYVKWILENNITGSLSVVKNEVIRLIQIFDSKPFINQNCNICKSPASRFTVYKNNIRIYWWCNNCDPYQAGALPGRIQMPITYKQALRHVENYCCGRKLDYKNLIKQIARGKGLPMRVGEAQAINFFINK